METIKPTLKNLEGLDKEFILWSPEYNPIPISKKKYPCVLGDWMWGFSIFIENYKKFSIVFTDKLGIERIGERLKTRYLPAFMLAYDTAKYFESEKDIDIVFIGNLNPEVQIERGKYIRRLALLSKKGINVFIGGGIYGEEYYKLISRAKIIFNRSIRREANMRLFESVKVMALPIIEEENLEAKDFFEPQKELIIYNEKNFEDILYYYIKNDKERENIVKRAKGRAEKEKYGLDFVQKIIEKNSFFEDVKINEKEKIKSLRSGINASISFSSFLREFEILIKLYEEFTEKNEFAADALNDIGVLLLYASIYLSSKEYNEKSIEKFIKAIEINPKNIIYWINLFLAVSKLGYKEIKYKEILKIADNILKLSRSWINSLSSVSSFPEPYQPTIFFPNQYYKMLFENYWSKWFHRELELKNGIMKVLLSIFFFIFAQIEELLGEKDKAIEFYSNSLFFEFTPLAAFKFYSLKAEKSPSETVENLVKLYEEYPLFFNYWDTIIETLDRLGRREEMQKILDDMKTIKSVTKSFIIPVNSKYVNP